MTHVTEIAFTGYPVTNMARARAFYEGVLALSPSATFENEGKAWIEYDIGASTLAISNMAPNWKPSSDGPAIAFEVDDFDVTIAALRAAGVRFPLEPMTSPVCKMAVICDPDGNCLVIHKRNCSCPSC